MAHERKKDRPEGKTPTAPEVVYTQPQALDRKKLILRLVTVVAVVFALFIGFSLFFRVDTIEVSGTSQYTPQMVVNASGIEDGDSLLFFGEAKACGNIAQSLHYVKSVRIGIKLPGTVKIYIEEVKMTYSIQDQADNWWLMASDGRIMQITNALDAPKHTMITGLRLLGPKAGTQAKAMETEVEATDEKGEIVEVKYTNDDRLYAALKIISRLEYRNVLGKAAVVDVTDMDDIVVQMRRSEKDPIDQVQFEVLLGDPEELDYKVDTMLAAIDGLGSHESGTLEILYGIPPQQEGSAGEHFKEEVWYAEYTPLD